MVAGAAQARARHWLVTQLRAQRAPLRWASDEQTGWEHANCYNGRGSSDGTFSAGLGKSGLLAATYRACIRSQYLFPTSQPESILSHAKIIRPYETSQRGPEAALKTLQAEGGIQK
eukprot:6180102-Pleurochrysis_carterae.AAC.1